MMHVGPLAVRLAISVGAALVCLGMADTGLAAAPKSSPSWTWPAEVFKPRWFPVPPVLEVLCARLAAFGLVEPMAMEPRSAPRRECKPVLLPIGDGKASAPTSIFTTVRAGPGGVARTLHVRFKINALQPQTQGRAVALVLRAARSILHGYDLEMPESLAVALQGLEDGRHSVGSIRLGIATEREDPRRHNIFLAILNGETEGAGSGWPEFPGG